MKLLDIKIDNKLNINNHINEILKNRREIKRTVKGYQLHGLVEEAHVVLQFFSCLNPAIVL